MKKTILVVNPKGGSGKTTLATNLAGYFAQRGEQVVLADFDRQLSASDWLQRRPDTYPSIIGWNGKVARGALAKIDPDWIVIDAPAGVHGEKLDDAIDRSDLVLVPVVPSAFDTAATEKFFTMVQQVKSIKKGQQQVALVGMRVDSRTLSAAELGLFLDEADFPVLTNLRATQNYVFCAQAGLSIFDLPQWRAEIDIEQWRPLLRWIKQQAK